MMPSLCPPCVCGCPVFADNFDRADETIADSGSDTTHHWAAFKGDNANDWLLSGNQIEITTSGVSGYPYRPSLQCLFLGPAHASASVRCKLPTSGKAQLQFISGSNQGLFSAEIEAGTTCGFLRLFSFGLSGFNDTATQFPGDVPVPGLEPDTWVTLKLCLDPDTKLLSAGVTIGSNTYWHHAKDVVISGTPTATTVFLAVDASITGTYFFDDFSIGQTKASLGSYDYGYGYYGDNGCPCCGPGNCESAGDDFEDGTIDCRWDQASGTWSESGGAITTSDSDARLLWLGSWSGIDFECLPDSTAKVSATFSVAGYGQKVVLIADYVDSGNYHYLQVSVESSSGAADGTIKLFSSIGGELSSAAAPALTIDQDIQADVCVAFGFMQAGAGGAFVSASITEFFGTQAGVGTGSGGSAVNVKSFSVSHDIANPGCPDCSIPGGGACDDGYVCCRDFPLPGTVNMSVIGDVGNPTCTVELSLDLTGRTDNTFTYESFPNIPFCSGTLTHASVGCAENAITCHSVVINLTVHLPNGSSLIIALGTNSFFGDSTIIPSSCKPLHILMSARSAFQSIEITE